MFYRYLKNKIKTFLRNARLLITKRIYDKGNGAICIIDNFIVEQNIKSIVIVNKTGKIGDIVVNSFIFREIKKNFPDIEIGVIARGNAKEIIKFNPNIEKIFDYNKEQLMALGREIGQQKYDLLIFMTEEVKEKEMKFISMCNARFNCGINKSNWNLFNISVDIGKDFEYDDHLTKCYSAILKKLGVKSEIDTSYDVYLDRERIKKIKLLENEYKDKKIMVLNPYGAGKFREFNREKIIKIIQKFSDIDWKIYLLYYGHRYEEVREISLLFDNVIIPDNISSILDSAMYIKLSDIIITPDTGIVHIASAFDKKIIAVYQYPKEQLNEWIDYKIWYPKTKNKCIVLFPSGKLNKYNIDNETVDINNFEFIEMENAINKML
ncbi:glycosyltransferase family 9 protein [Fusobacterium sp. PH5-44]|uniref:glycosyltransferase family 9 protein n=1 Tax=unclassified Fusobacterium TaxID=2648384 RepID=UPI003D2356C1